MNKPHGPANLDFDGQGPKGTPQLPAQAGTHSAPQPARAKNCPSKDGDKVSPQVWVGSAPPAPPKSTELQGACDVGLCQQEDGTRLAGHVAGRVDQSCLPRWWAHPWCSQGRLWTV